MKKIFFAAVAALLTSIAPASAQQLTEQVHQFTSIKSVKATDAFQVTIVPNAEACEVKITATDIVSDAVKVYLQHDQVVLELDKKLITKENKALMKGKNAIVPVLRAEVSMQTVEGITLCDKASMTQVTPITADKMEISLSDNSKIEQLSLNCQDLEISLRNKAGMTAQISTKDMEVNAANSSAATLTADASTLKADISNSAEVSVKGTLKKVNAEASNSSKLTLEGSANDITVNGTNSATIDASNLPAADADVALRGADCWINARDIVKVELSGGAYLVFSNSPKIDLVRVEKSTLIRPSDDKKKK